MRRRLFLDDDPARAAVFTARHPDACWVETAPACLEKLAERWDEVHLDHDLGGEHFVESTRPDCGMEVVRWLTAEPRPHLAVYQHNLAWFRYWLQGWRDPDPAKAAQYARWDAMDQRRSAP